MKVETFIVDFPDAQTAKIYADRWVHSASLMGIVYQHSVIPYGEGKFHYKAIFDGHVEDVERLMSFINESLGLLDGSEIKNEN